MNIPQDIKYVFNLFRKYNYKIYIVGGCVRDSIMNRQPHDWDFTTNALPNEMIEICEKENIKYIPTGVKHGTLTFLVNDIGYEITTFRIDGKSQDHRHSDEVTFVNDIVQDLARRDFTINAIAYNDLEGIIDPFKGIEDINNKIIRCVGDSSERFNEDALRMLRAARFCGQLGFDIDIDTASVIPEITETLKFISKERIRDELCKTLISNNPIKGLHVMTYLGMMDYIIPQLIKCVGFDQNNRHHDKNVYEHIMSVVENSPAKLDIRLAALLHDIGKPECYTVGDDGEGHFYRHHLISQDISEIVLKDLKFDNNTIKKVSILIREHMSRYEHLRTPNIKKFINRVGINNLDDLFELQIADIKGSTKRDTDFNDINNLKEQCYKILNEKQPLTIKDLAINGNDLMSIGYKPGKELGNKLKELLELVLNEVEPNKKERLLELSKNSLLR